MICYERNDVGKEVYKAFREQRLECDPPNVKFHDTTKKARVKTFTDLDKKIKVKASNNQEAEKRLFAQMIVVAECSNLQMGEVLAHLLGPVPRPLAKPDGTLPKTSLLGKGAVEEFTCRRCCSPTIRMLNRWHGFSSASKRCPENICLDCRVSA